MNGIPKIYIWIPIFFLIVFVFTMTFTYEDPKVIVYLDKDSKQPAILPSPEDNTIQGDRAALWWTVFNKCLERKGASINEARLTANTAVEAVYGSK